MDPRDRGLLEHAEANDGILVTLDTDVGDLIFARDAAHAGLVGLPDVPAERRITLTAMVTALEIALTSDRSGSIVR